VAGIEGQTQERWSAEVDSGGGVVVVTMYWNGASNRRRPRKLDALYQVEKVAVWARPHVGFSSGNRGSTGREMRWSGRSHPAGTPRRPAEFPVRERPRRRGAKDWNGRVSSRTSRVPKASLDSSARANQVGEIRSGIAHDSISRAGASASRTRAASIPLLQFQLHRGDGLFD
jgi:hypothetical protein